MTTFLILLTGLMPSGTSQWTGFRNDGRSIATGPTLPKTWSRTSGIRWQLELDGYGQSAPVVWNETVYVTSVVGPNKERCVIAAFDLPTGKQRWKYSIKAGTTAPSNYAVARAAPTPVVSADGVYAFFEGGDVIAVTHQGERRWHRSLTKDYGRFNNHHGLGASPVLCEGRLVLNIQHSGPSYLIALDARTGKTQWKVKRASAKSWTSPAVARLDGESQIIVSSAGVVDSYDVGTGSHRWELKGVGGNSIPSPTVIGNRVYVGAALSDFDTSANAALSNMCLQIKPDGYRVVWQARKALTEYASPLVYRGCSYYLSKTGVLYCLDAKTGKQLYVKRLGVRCWATPIAHGDVIYFFGRNGTTKVIKAGKTFEVVASNQLWKPEAPPKPEKYVESFGSHGKTKKKSSGGFAGMILRSDKNGDGKVSKEELPERLRSVFARIDLNKDGALDRGEIQKMSEQFRKRRQHSRTDSRDPIVYGAAAATGTIVIRTGTRLYCIRK